MGAPSEVLELAALLPGTGSGVLAPTLAVFCAGSGPRALAV